MDSEQSGKEDVVHSGVPTYKGYSESELRALLEDDELEPLAREAAKRRLESISGT